MNPRHELLREAASNLPAFHDEEKKAIRDTIEIEADLVRALEELRTAYCEGPFRRFDYALNIRIGEVLDKAKAGAA
ncbi:MAG: hypothetical protein M3O03_00380 [Pseudomonadota bacterium]|nr:hypothetical protein [Pseudomonadota bacterium]